MSDTNNNDNNKRTAFPPKIKIFRMLKVEKEFKYLLKEPEVPDDFDLEERSHINQLLEEPEVTYDHYLEETLYNTFNDFRDNEKQNHFNSK